MTLLKKMLSWKTNFVFYQKWKCSKFMEEMVVPDMSETTVMAPVTLAKMSAMAVPYRRTGRAFLVLLCRGVMRWTALLHHCPNICRACFCGDENGER